MTRARKAKWAALLAVALVAIGASTVGVTFGAFAGETAASANVITAVPDFRGPTIANVAIGKSTGYATGAIRSGGTYRLYANVDDVGTPPSGVATVTANVSNITAGETAAAMTAGTYSAGGVTYNYRSGQLTAETLPDGMLGFSVTATDAATNVSAVNGNVFIDSTAPAPSNISAAGGVASRLEVGDVFTLTTTEVLDTFRLLADWDGSATTVHVTLRNQGGGDRLEVRDSTGSILIPFGTISLGRTDYATANVVFPASTMAQSGGAITIVLGGTVTGTPATAGGTGTMAWTPSAQATDIAGNAMSTASFNEPAPLDRDF